ncbi:hypothetical protein [Leptospira biflexa]|jgi:hypothetical protein|nr:hypothetical protein [Leptospira biflexa]
MGDKNPKTKTKQTSQKNAKNAIAKGKKDAATAAKQVPTKK